MDDLYTEIYEKFTMMQGLLHRHCVLNHADCGPFANPARGQGRVLAMLKLQPEISTKELSYLLGIRQQSLNELLNKLERNDYIVRKPSEKDKRVMIVHLTEKGKNTQQEQNNYGSIFGCLDEEELYNLGGYLDRIMEVLEEQVGSAQGEAAADWMRSVRSRMGKEKFEHFMAMGHKKLEHCHGHMREHFAGDCGQPAPDGNEDSARRHRRPQRDT